MLYIYMNILHKQSITKMKHIFKKEKLIFSIQYIEVTLKYDETQTNSLLKRI